MKIKQNLPKNSNTAWFAGQQNCRFQPLSDAKYSDTRNGSFSEASLPSPFSGWSAAKLANIIGDCKSEVELCSVITPVLAQAGIPNFLVVNCRDKVQAESASETLLSNWPDTVLKSLIKSELFGAFYDDLVAGPNAMSGMCDFTLERYSGVSDQKHLQRILKFHGIIHGTAYICPQSFPLGNRILVLYGGVNLSQTNMAGELQQISPLLISRLVSLNSECIQSRPKLSKRERECLQWASEGKTSYEISVILCLSEHTINNYIASVSRKLRAMNRVHLMSIAIRKGYIA